MQMNYLINILIWVIDKTYKQNNHIAMEIHWIEYENICKKAAKIVVSLRNILKIITLEPNIYAKTIFS